MYLFIQLPIELPIVLPIVLPIGQVHGTPLHIVKTQ